MAAAAALRKAAGRMSDVVDLTLLSGAVTGIERDLRLLRLQVDNVVSRFASMEQRLAVLEQSFHDLVAEMSRGFGQMQQQAARQEKRLDVLDAGLSDLRAGMDDSTARIIEAIKARNGQ